ncbi:MAG: pilus assembly protein [Rhodospirillales bacterium]|nr:pilus assembly protein [Rhodospirillales bacterium]
MTRIKTALLRLWADLRAATAVEFALLFPIVVFFVLSLFEFGLIIYEYHLISEATRRGARNLVVNDSLNSPVTALTNIESTDATCTGSGCDAAPFALLLADMQGILPDLAASNVTVTYSNTGLTGGSLVTPRVTVEVVGYQHSSTIYGAVLGNSSSNKTFTFTYPSFSTSRILASRNNSEL